MEKVRRLVSIKFYIYQCLSIASISANFIILPLKSLALLSSRWEFAGGTPVRASFVTPFRVERLRVGTAFRRHCADAG